MLKYPVLVFLLVRKINIFRSKVLDRVTLISISCIGLEAKITSEIPYCQFYFVSLGITTSALVRV